MKKKIALWILITVACLGLLAACSSGGDRGITDNNGISATLTPSAAPSNMPKPTHTPTATPSPTPSPTPTPTPIPEFTDIISETDEPGLYTVPEQELEGYFLNVNYFNGRIVYFFNQGISTPPRIISYDIENDKSTVLDLEEVNPLRYDYEVIPGKYIVVIDNSKYMTFLDKDLKKLYSFEVPLESETPIYSVSDDYSKIYYIRNKTLYECETSTGKEKELLTDSIFYDAHPIKNTPDGKYLKIYAYSRRSGYYEYYLLDLKTKELLHLDDWLDDCSCFVSPDKKELFLADLDTSSASLYSTGDIPEDSFYLLNTGESLPEELLKSSLDINSINEVNSPFVDWDRRRVITYDYLTQSSTSIMLLTCYDMDTGEAVSNCTLCLEDPVVQDPALAIDTKDGFILISGAILKDVYCYAWDYVNDDYQGEGTQLIRYDHIPEYLDNYRKELEEKYGIFIYVGTEIFATEHNYTLTYSGNYARAMETLHILDEVFSMYPEDIFSQLRFGGIRTIGIYLCGGFTKKDSYGIDTAVALAGFDGYERYLALDISYYGDMRRNIIHEISHWLDKKVEYCGDKTGEFDFEEVWNSNNPEGFYYMDDYNVVSPFSKYTYDYGNDSDYWFIDTYSLTTASEDRARLFEYLMRYSGTDYFRNEHLRAKLHTYFDYIRKSYDTTNWPEETIWEYTLNMLDRMYSGDNDISLIDIYPEYYNGDPIYSETDDDYGYLGAYVFFSGYG